MITVPDAPRALGARRSDMYIAAVVVFAIAATLVWMRAAGRQVSLGDGFGSPQRVSEVLHASVAAVPANSFDARLRITRR